MDELPNKLYTDWNLDLDIFKPIKAGHSLNSFCLFSLYS